MLWCCASHPWHGNRGRTSHMKKSLSSSHRHPRLMWCDKDKHNAAVSLSLIAYCFSLLRISSLAGIGLCSRHLRPIKKQTQGPVWFAGWFPIQLLFWRLVGGMVMKGLTARAIAFAALVFHISFRGTNESEKAASVHKIHRWDSPPWTRIICKRAFLAHWLFL